MMSLALLTVSVWHASASGSLEFAKDQKEAKIAPASTCLNGPCAPGNDFCGQPFANAPAFHLMDQHGCGENDPNGPVFDPVHGVVHHFYQIHLAAVPGHGPDYGHFVSKDFVNWADVRTAIWNGLDSSVTPPRVTKYDNEAIFTGSAFVIDGAGPGGKGPGVINLYPGLCNKNDWPACGTGTLLAQAVPADYQNDQLLINWTKPSYNPVMENTQRDPSGAWKTPSGELRIRTYDNMYGAASEADVVAGKWYEIGASPDMRTCECPSLYPLPASTPGFEEEYLAAAKAGTLPTHVHKTSCGGDWWQMGTYTDGPPKTKATFKATPGWEDVYAQKKIDVGQFYASKDNEYPTKDGGKRRINWGWATVPPASTQSLPRVITFNVPARVLEQAPLPELVGLRGASAYSNTNVKVAASSPTKLGLTSGVAKQSEVVATFALPSVAQTFGVSIGIGAAPAPSGTPVTRLMKETDLTGGNDYNITHLPAGTDPSVCQAACDADAKCQAWTYVIRGSPAGSGDCCLKSSVPCPHAGVSSCTSGAKKAQNLPGCGSGPSGGTLACTVNFSPPSNLSAAYYEVPVNCGGKQDTLRLLQSEKTLEIRVFSDWTFAEAYFQKGRVAMTVTNGFVDDADIALTATADIVASSVDVYPMKGIWVSPDDVRNAKRVYPAIGSSLASLVV